MLLVGLVASLLASVASVLIGYFGISSDDRRKSKPLRRLWLAAFPTALTAVFQFCGGMSADARAERAESVEKKTLATMTGGNSFCFLRPWNSPVGQMRLAVSVEGPYPMYDVQITAINLSVLRSVDRPGVTFEEAQASADLFSKNLEFTLPLRPGTNEQSSTQFSWPASNEHEFLINVSARNVRLVERLIVREGHYALIVFRVDAHGRAFGNYVKLHLPLGFPGGVPFSADLSAVNSVPGVRNVDLGDPDETSAAGIELGPNDVDLTFPWNFD
ncbi:MAG: hypothetical protein QM831_25580 [Kofleriaceae bacterium]